MTKSFFRWLREKLNNVEDDEYRRLGKLSLPVEEPSASIVNQLDVQPLRINIVAASGGRIVECNRYDRKTDRSITGVYIVLEDQDLGHELSKIITMEYLK